MRFPALPLSALAAAFALAACNQPTPTTNDDSANAVADDMTANGDAVAPEASPTDTADTPPVVAAPTIAPDAPVAAAAPLAEAAQAATTIAGDRDVSRVEWGDGWAWKRNGQVIRTASRDGSRVSYFRPGADHPYLVQNKGESYGYDDNGKLARVYDRSGRPGTPDARQRGDADRLNNAARRDRDRARTAQPPRPAADSDPRSRTGANGRDDRPRSRPTPTPTLTPTPTPTSGTRDRHDRGDADRTDRRSQDRRTPPMG